MLIIRYIYGFVFMLLALGAFMGLVALFPVVSQDWRVYRWFILGLIAYVSFMGITNAFFDQNLKFFRTFTHELTHTIFTILSLKRVRAFQATSHQGGEIHVVGGGNMLILLSPYCIPIFTIGLLLLRPLFQIQFAPYLEFAIGISYFFHLHTNWLQTGRRQTDITKYPLLTSYSFIWFFHFLLIGILFLSFQKGLSAFWEFPKVTFESIKLLASFIITK